MTGAAHDPRTLALLAHLGRGGTWQYFCQFTEKKETRFFHVGKPLPLPQWSEVYFCVNPGKEKPKAGRGTIQNVAAINCLFAEFDNKDGATKEMIEALDPAPSVIVFSGGGCHCYWLLQEPEIVTADNLHDLMRIQAAWVERAGGDPNAKDLARVLRVPGSTNNKPEYGTPKPVDFIRAKFSQLYPLADLVSLLPQAPIEGEEIRNEARPAPSSTPAPTVGKSGGGLLPRGEHFLRKYQAEGTPGNRDDAGFNMACQLRDSVAAGSETEAGALAALCSYAIQSPTDSNHPDPYTEKDARRWWKSAHTRTARPDAQPGYGKPQPQPEPIEPAQPGSDPGGDWADCDYGEPPEEAPIDPSLTQTPAPAAQASKPTATKKPAEIDFSAMPPLPDWAVVNPAGGAGAGGWIDLYSKYAAAVSPMTPALFHESAALWLASVAIARRLVLPMSFGEIYPNLFILWLADTTLYRKTTAINPARKLADDIFPYLLAAQDTTPEAFLSDLAGTQPTNFSTMATTEQAQWEKERNFSAQRGKVIDELSGLLAGAGKDYNAGLLEALLRFYDCDPAFTRSTISRGRITVKDSYLTMLGASTPGALAEHMKNERLWSNGWWPRFAILTPEGRPTWAEAEYTPRPPELESGLGRLFSRLPSGHKWPTPPEALTVTISPEAFTAWSKYNRALSFELLTDDLPHLLFGAYGRLPTHALKVAMILAALDWPENTPAPRIEHRHMIRAISIAESWRASYHRSIAKIEETEFSKAETRITKIIARGGQQGATFRDICKGMKDKQPLQLQMTIDEMLAKGSIIENTAGSEGKRGRPTTRFMLVKD